MTQNKILLVDDEKSVVRLLKAALCAPEYLIEEAYDGSEALKKINSFHPDIILLDINMPVMDGLEVCKHIRKESAHAFSKIILVSGNSEIDDRLKGYTVGANDYVTKPFNILELKAKIDVLLRLKYSEEVNTLKESFLMLLNHEQNTPLNAILGFAQLLESSTSLDEEERSYVKQILTSGFELAEKNERLLRYCELKTSQKVEWGLHSANLLIENSSKGLMDAIDEKSLSLTFKPAEDYTVSVDGTLMTSAIKNIIENAIHFSPKNADISISSTLSNGTWDIVISNEGRPIPDDQIDLIFNPFYCKNVYHHSSGLGLSLALSKLIIELHDGDIKAENKKGGGVNFTIQIPLKSI